MPEETRCAYRIFKESGEYGIAINVTDSTSASWSDFSGYNLYVNGNANIGENLNVGGTISGGSFTPTNPLAVEYGGTGATTAANARTNLDITPANIGAKPIQSEVSGGTNNGIRFLATYSQNANGVVTMTDALVRDASTTQSGLVGTGAQTFAGTKSFSGEFRFKNSGTNPQAFFQTSASGEQILGRIFFNTVTVSTYRSPQAFYFRQQSYNATTGATIATFEDYKLPTTAAALGANATYTILTTKAAVTVAQGGTGATTAAGALTNIGAASAGHNHDSTYKKIQTAVNDPTYDGDSVTFIDSISQNTQGVITVTKKAVRSANSTQNGLVTIGNQTFSGTKNFNNPIVRGDSPSLYFQSTAAGTQTYGRIFAYGAVTSNYKRPSSMYFLINSYNSTTGVVSTFYEEYHLPTVTADRTDSSDFAILTTKTYSLPTTWRAATISTSGVVTINAQSFAGNKTFTGIVTSTYGGNGFQLKHGTASTDCFFYAERTDTGAKVGVGVGSGGTNHGLYSFTMSAWMVYANASEIFANINTFNNIITVKGSVDIQTAWGYLRWKKSIGNQDVSALIAANNATTTDPARFSFYQYILDSSGNHITNDVYERFLLPAVTTTRTASIDYSILTTKNLVTVAQGGTGMSAVTSNVPTLTASNGHFNTMTGIKVYRYGKMGWLLSTGVEMLSHSYSGWVTVATFPTAYTPMMTTTVRIPITDTNFRVQLTTDCKINIYKTTSDTTLFYCAIPFPIA